VQSRHACMSQSRSSGPLPAAFPALPAFPPVPLRLPTPTAQVDARALTRELLRRYFGLVLALNEACLLHLDGRRLLLRVTATNTLDAEAQEEQLAYHCFRGGRHPVLCGAVPCSDACGT
jgi:hypothetical protein